MLRAYDLNEEQLWLRNRNIEFALYNTTFGFNGKKIFKEIKSPRDLYKLPGDTISKSKVKQDPKRAWEAYNKSKGTPKWLKS